MSSDHPDANPSACTRRTMLERGLAMSAAAAVGPAIIAEGAPLAGADPSADRARPWLTIRGLYGGFPREIFERGETPADYGLNAVWTGSGNLDAREIERLHKHGVKVFAEFNSMHSAGYLKDHPDAAPIGRDGKPEPAPDGWQGVSPFHAGYRRERMDEFRRVLKTYEIDGIWLDYHHAHSAWEQEVPKLPDTDFSAAALAGFTKQTGITLPADTAAAADLLLGPQREAWTKYRCDVFADWVREYRAIVDAVRPRALLGTFHCSWSPDELDGAIRHKLAIDLPSQAPYLDVFSIMPYHARFGHHTDPAWIGRQTRKLGALLGIEGKPDEKKKIWPIVQLSDWGERVPVEQIETVLEQGSLRPATGVMGFHWSKISAEWEKVRAVGRAYTAFRGA
jgi:hypothetical protein